MKWFRKKNLIALCFVAWLLIVTVNIVREVYTVYPMVRSRHNFHYKCMHDLKYRMEYLEACSFTESLGNQPTNLYADVFMEAIPRVRFLVFFEFNDLFSVQSLVKIGALAICKTMLGDLFVGMFRRTNHNFT